MLPLDGMYKELIKKKYENGKSGTCGSGLLVRLGDLLAVVFLEWRDGGVGDREGGEREGERVR